MFSILLAGLRASFDEGTIYYLIQSGPLVNYATYREKLLERYRFFQEN